METTFSENLKKYLDRKNVTQQELADQIGVHKSSVSLWCSGQTAPRMEKMQAVADYLGITVADLVTEKNGPQEREPDVVALYNALISHGYIKEGQDLSDRDVEFLSAISKFIKVWFER